MNNNYIKVQVEGKKVHNYLKWLIKQKINILNLKLVNSNILELHIYDKDYSKLSKYSKSYKIKIINKHGRTRFFELLISKTYIILSIVISIIFLYFLSNIIFKVEIIHNNSELINVIEKELKKYEIEKYKFKKDYSYLNTVKEEILKNNKDSIEWIEIVENGTKYTVKFVERKKETIEKGYTYQSISTTKDAVITKIKAKTGEKIKEINDYVKEGEVIVSGVLVQPDGTELYTKADATIYGEVWYNIDIEYPYANYEEKTTGQSKKVFIINFLNKKIPLFTYQKYKEFKIKEKNIIIENNILPISLSKEKQYEVIVTEDIYTWEEALSNAVSLSKKKLLESNRKIININKVDIIDKKTIGGKIKLNLFVSVEEDITKIIEIEPNKNNEKN